MALTYDRVLQESTLFEMFESEAYTDTVKALKLAEQEIILRIMAIKGETWTKAQLIEIKTLVDQEIAKAYADTLVKLQSELPGIAEVTAQNMLLASFTKVPTKVIDAITSNSFQVQGYTQSELFRTTSENHARQIRVLISSGVAQGKTSNTIINELIRKNSSLTKGQLNNAIFTTITEARATTRYNSYEQLEKMGVVDFYEYTATLDSRTTKYCMDHDGRVYYKSMKEIQHLINTHFGCRSVFVPGTKTTKKTTRASQFGSVPAESYSKWFERQNESFQRQVLGNKYSLYKNGSYKIGGLPDIGKRKISLDDIKSTLIETQEQQLKDNGL